MGRGPREVMRILLVAVKPKRGAGAGPAAELTAEYLGRAARYMPVSSRVFPDEASVLAFLEAEAGRTRPALVLADSHGKPMSSEEFAAALGGFQDAGVQQVVVAIGPADGWSAEALKRANLTISFGRITLPHELAAVVMAEQIYRALTIRAGHPYHCGH